MRARSHGCNAENEGKRRDRNYLCCATSESTWSIGQRNKYPTDVKFYGRKTRTSIMKQHICILFVCEFNQNQFVWMVSAAGNSDGSFYISTSLQSCQQYTDITPFCLSTATAFWIDYYGKGRGVNTADAIQNHRASSVKNIHLLIELSGPGQHDKIHHEMMHPVNISLMPLAAGDVENE